MAYMKKPSKKMYGGKKKKMYKKGSFLEPGKEIKFGGPMKKQRGGVPKNARPGINEEDARSGKPRAEAAARAKAQREAKAREAERQKPMNKIARGEMPEGAKKATDGRSTVSKVLTKLESTPSAKPKPTGPKPGTYAYAKKRNPNLDKLIKQRKGHTKGTEEYNRVQNQINRAYGKGPMRKEISKVASRPAPKTTVKPTLKTPAKPAAPAAKKPAPKPAPRPKVTPSGGSGMGAVNKMDDLKKELKGAASSAKKPMDRRGKRAARKSERLKKRVSRLQDKMMDGGKRKMGMGGYGKMKYGKGGLKMVKGKDGKMVPFYAADGKGKMMGGGMYKPYKAGGKKKSLKETTPDQKGLRKLPTAVRNKMGYKKAGGPAQQAAIAISMKKAGKKPKMMKKGGGMSGLSAAQKQVYKRGLAAYMSSGNRPKVSQHAWAMARVKSDFGKREAAKIRSGKSGKSKKK